MTFSPPQSKLRMLCSGHAFTTAFKNAAISAWRLEMFSDGYFKTGEQSTISSWEQGFREVEAEDPYKIGKYPTVKGSTADIFTDDRTIVITKFSKTA